MIKKISLLILILIAAVPVYAQNLNSTTYTLIAPSIDSNSGISNSTNYSILQDSSPVDDYITTSSTYRFTGGTAEFIEAKTPSIICFETSTNSSTTTCTGVPGGDGMRGVCSSPGCYDRAKLEFNTQNNSDDVKYAIQIATNAAFTTGVQYISGASHTPKATLTLSDFLYQCEWEGNIYSSYCVSTNTTYQKYNILGLTHGTLYYIRVAALKGSTSAANFTQSDWSASATATTQNTTISFDIDIAPNSSTPTNPPYALRNINIIPESTFVSDDYLFLKSTTNALNGVYVTASVAGSLLYNNITGDTIDTYSGDLDTQASGWGIINITATNSASNTANLGDIIIYTFPVDFTETGAANKVGGLLTSPRPLFYSDLKPLYNGVAGFKFKARTDYSKPAGQYSQTMYINVATLN